MGWQLERQRDALLLFLFQGRRLVFADRNENCTAAQHRSGAWATLRVSLGAMGPGGGLSRFFQSLMEGFPWGGGGEGWWRSLGKPQFSTQRDSHANQCCMWAPTLAVHVSRLGTVPKVPPRYHLILAYSPLGRDPALGGVFSPKRPVPLNSMRTRQTGTGQVAAQKLPGHQLQRVGHDLSTHSKTRVTAHKSRQGSLGWRWAGIVTDSSSHKLQAHQHVIRC